MIGDIFSAAGLDLLDQRGQEVLSGALQSKPGGVFIEAVTQKGEEALSKSGLNLSETPAGRDEAVKKLPPPKATFQKAETAMYAND